MTSHDVVGRCRRIFGQKKVGHAGTLDPDATGVLLVGLGRATRLMQYMSGLGKTYTTEIVLGAATSTLDDSGEVTGSWDMSGVTLEQAAAAAGRLTGVIDQVPPMVSAVKVAGKRLHQLAREGIEVERAARRVVVDRFELGWAAAGVLSAVIECSSGTYVRVLADDLGRLLGGGAHVRRLRRTAVGPWRESDATPLDGVGPAQVLAPVEALPWLEAVRVDGETEAAVRFGRPMSGGDLGAHGPGPWRVVGADGALLAVYEADRRVVLAGG
ncbi:MAG: tRNA pseudouridine(55) synthase TruB [Acidobacteriota bacterium]|nr:tRNA pseudouridine(55) synthase TruB [Acidobacteriota bacterium]